MGQWYAPLLIPNFYYPGQSGEVFVYLTGDSGFGLTSAAFVKADFVTPLVSVKEGERWYFRYTLVGDSAPHNVIRVVAQSSGNLLSPIDRMYAQDSEGNITLSAGLTNNPMGGLNPAYGASVAFTSFTPASQSIVGVLSGFAANNGGGTATLSLSYTIPD